MCKDVSKKHIPVPLAHFHKGHFYENTTSPFSNTFWYFPLIFEEKVCCCLLMFSDEKCDKIYGPNGFIV